MPRVRRRQVPGAVTHVIVRFVNAERIMDLVAGARARYLDDLERALRDSDWTLCWYCLMGNHVHLGLVSGEAPLQSWTGRVHSGWAGWVNRSGRRKGQRSRGPVMAERPTSLFIPDGRAAMLGAYIHNNPVRAGLVASAADSTWSSHRAYLGLEDAPPVLNIERGLAYCGCTGSDKGRQRFDELVASCARFPKDSNLSGGTAIQARESVRRQLGPAAEISTPVIVDASSAHYPPLRHPHAYNVVRYVGSPDTYLAEIARVLQTSIHVVCAPGRRRPQTDARRLAVLCWRALGRRTSEIAASLNISATSATNLALRATAEQLAAADRTLELLDLQRMPKTRES